MELALDMASLTAQDQNENPGITKEGMTSAKWDRIG
jgi:hypothetical protein